MTYGVMILRVLNNAFSFMSTMSLPSNYRTVSFRSNRFFDLTFPRILPTLFPPTNERASGSPPLFSSQRRYWARFSLFSTHYRGHTLDHNSFHDNKHFKLKTVSISNKTYIQKWKIIDLTLLTCTQCLSLASWWPSGSTKTFSVFMKLWFSLFFSFYYFS